MILLSVLLSVLLSICFLLLSFVGLESCINCRFAGKKAVLPRGFVDFPFFDDCMTLPFYEDNGGAT